MFTIALTILGASYGAYRAKRLGGKAMDQLQFGAGFAIAGFTLAMIIAVIIDQFIA